jgi:hypothetical protein
MVGGAVGGEGAFAGGGAGMEPFLRRRRGLNLIHWGVSMAKVIKCKD